MLRYAALPLLAAALLLGCDAQVNGTCRSCYGEGGMDAGDAGDASDATFDSSSPDTTSPDSSDPDADVPPDAAEDTSVVLEDAEPATADAAAVARLRAAGAVIVGRTHMSEFAYTGVGVNPHFPQPVNPHDDERVPGGSSSGAGVSVVQGAAAVGLGTDTGGSVRIPAALCGAVGSWMAEAALQLLAGGKPRPGLLVYDALDGRVRRVGLSRDPACAVCGDTPDLLRLDPARYVAPSCAV